MNRYQKHEWVDRRILTTSEQGRAVPLVMIGNPEAKKHIMLTCRHHSCESTASYAVEGIVTFLLDQRSELLERFRLHFIPFVDIDGVENGDQGKARAPHDHNRDYTDTPIYKSVKAIMEYGTDLDWSVALDFHCPIKWAKPEYGKLRDDYPFFVKQSPFIMKDEVEALGTILQQITASNPNTDKIQYDPYYDLEPGEAWNRLEDAPFFGNFMLGRCSKLVGIVEYPYFGTGNAVVTEQSSRLFGADFAQALEKYLLNEK